MTLSQLENKEEIIKTSNSLLKYRVVKEEIDLKKLEEEKAFLENQLNLPKPTQEELIETGKAFHPYFTTNKEEMRKRLEEINKLLSY